MTIKTLIEELRKVPPDHLVVASRDAERNGFSKVLQAEPGRFEEFRGGFGGRGDLEAGGEPNCVVIWPA